MRRTWQIAQITDAPDKFSQFYKKMQFCKDKSPGGTGPRNARPLLIHSLSEFHWQSTELQMAKMHYAWS